MCAESSAHFNFIIMSAGAIFGEMALKATDQVITNAIDTGFYRKRSEIQNDQTRFNTLLGLKSTARLPSYQVAGLRGAGLNPALAEGGSMTATTGSPSSASSSSSLSDILGAVAQDANIEAIESNTNLNNSNAEKARAEAEALRRINKGNKEADDFTSFVMSGQLKMDDNGTLVDGEGNLIRPKDLPTTKEGWQALQSFDKHLRDSRVRHSESVKALLDDMVATLQIKDTDVVNAMIHLPDSMYQKILKETKKTESEITYQDILNEVMKASKYIHEYVSKSDNDILKFIASAIFTFTRR